MDSNDILFGGTPHDIISLISDQYLFDVAMNVWDGEIILLVHAKTKKVIAVHRPLSLGADSRPFIHSWQCVLRCMTTEVLKRIVHYLLSVDSEFTGDAIYGGYAYEYVRNALHFSEKAFVAAAFVRDATTRPEDHPLRQNRLGKTVSDPNYPITPGLRKDYHRAEPIDRKLNPLIVYRACTRLTFVDDANDPEQIQNCIQDVDSLLKEDQPSITTVTRRWVATLDGIDPTCLLRQAIQDALEARKPNKGNPKSYGLRDDEKIEYNDDFLHMEALPLQTPFWVRTNDHQDPVPTTADDKGYTIFSTFTHKGLIGRVREKRSSKASGNEALRFNTTHYIADRPQQHLNLGCVKDTRGRRQYIGEDGRKSFVLVWLMACSPDINETKQLQLGLIENLKLGTHFVIRKNSRSSSEIPIPELPEEYVGAPIFNMPVWTGVRDRLAKFDRAAKEIKEIELGDWMLCEVVVRERRGPRSGAVEEEEKEESDSDDDRESDSDDDESDSASDDKEHEAIACIYPECDFVGTLDHVLYCGFCPDDREYPNLEKGDKKRPPTTLFPFVCCQADCSWRLKDERIVTLNEAMIISRKHLHDCHKDLPQLREPFAVMDSTTNERGRNRFYCGYRCGWSICKNKEDRSQARRHMDSCGFDNITNVDARREAFDGVGVCPEKECTWIAKPASGTFPNARSCKGARTGHMNKVHT